MKKILFILLLCVGCSKSSYDLFVERVKNTNNNNELPFNVEFHIGDVNEERIIYQVIIDDAKYELNSVKAMVINDSNSEDVYPSIGVVDESISLNSETKGINLVGYANKREVNFKLLVIANDIEYIYNYNYR